MLEMFQLSNKLFEADDRKTSMLNQDWDEMWGVASIN